MPVSWYSMCHKCKTLFLWYYQLSLSLWPYFSTPAQCYLLCPSFLHMSSIEVFLKSMFIQLENNPWNLCPAQCPPWSPWAPNIISRDRFKVGEMLLKEYSCCWGLGCEISAHLVAACSKMTTTETPKMEISYDSLQRTKSSILCYLTVGWIQV